MVRYIQHLQADIEHSLRQAPPSLREAWDVGFDADDGDPMLQGMLPKLTKLQDLLGIAAEAFPPDHFLSDEQVERMRTELSRLWKGWMLWWDMPQGLNPRQEYSAMLHAMQVAELEWSHETGGTVEICRFEGSRFCPFGKDGGYCYCRNVDEAAKHDIAIWEEHVRSQGFDPSWEGEAFVDEEMRAWQLRKQRSDDWAQHDALDALGEPTKEPNASSGIGDDDNDWLGGFFADEQEDTDEFGEDDKQGRGQGLRKNGPSDHFFDDNGFGSPFSDFF